MKEIVARNYQQVKRLETHLAANFDCYNVDDLTTHHFCEGLYARKLFYPAGTCVVGKLHARENFLVLLSGDITITTDEGVMRVQPPFMCVTLPGTKRAIYAHTDSYTVNFHTNPDNLTGQEELEELNILPETELLEVLP